MKNNTLVRETKAFGDFSPYIFWNDGNVVLEKSFADIYNHCKNIDWELDLSAVLALLNFNYVLGDRTLIKDIYRMPWHSHLDSDNKITRNPPIPHANNLHAPESIAEKFIEFLEGECLREFKNYDTLWVLQTGGLDSRVTLAVLNKLQTEGKLDSKIHLVTWGDLHSRDVIYSQKLADKYQYEWHHIDINSQVLEQNIEIAVNYGAAEVSAFHYHGMHELQSLVSDADCVVASSYGDSIGRAEYSGSHLVDVNLPVIANPFKKIFNPEIFHQHKTILENDRSRAWITDREQSKIIQNELDMQENYMRRMIAHAMDYIGSYTTLKQTFTSEELVSFAFSISPMCRNFDTYYHIFRKIDPSLLEIPWARTGVSLCQRYIDNVAAHKKEYHNYREWFLRDYYEKVENTLLEGKLIKNQIILKAPLLKVLRRWKTNSDYSELLSKLYQIELLILRYSLKVEYQECSLTQEIKTTDLMKKKLYSLISKFK